VHNRNFACTCVCVCVCVFPLCMYVCVRIFPVYACVCFPRNNWVVVSAGNFAIFLWNQSFCIMSTLTNNSRLKFALKSVARVTCDDKWFYTENNQSSEQQSFWHCSSAAVEARTKPCSWPGFMAYVRGASFAVVETE